MIRRLLLLLILASAALRAAGTPTVILVCGPAGDAEFAPDFTAQVKAWTDACARAGATLRVIGEGAAPVEGAEPDRERLRRLLGEEAAAGGAELWLVLVGHGTFDGRESRFNLRGPDFTSAELAEWLQPVRRPFAFVHTGSASAPFLPRLAGPGRIVVTATRSGNEQNYTRFGRHFAEAVAEPASDLDRDGQVSLLEAYLAAAHRTREFYKAAGRLATEHPLLDDNGDGLGTPPDWFRGVLATRRARDGAALDGLRAHQFHLVPSAEERRLSPEARARRDTLEARLAEIRARKAQLAEDAYLRELEAVLRELAEVYAAP